MSAFNWISPRVLLWWMRFREVDTKWTVALCTLFLVLTSITWLSFDRYGSSSAEFISHELKLQEISQKKGNSTVENTTEEIMILTNITLEESSNNTSSEFHWGAANVRGFVKKRGMVPPFYFTSYASPARHMAFDRWLTAYTHGTLLYGFLASVYVNHHYRFIWIKGHKVASTAMRKPLGQLCGDKWKVSANVSFKYCAKPLFQDNEVTVAEIRKWWKEYFVFGIVRNPYTRFASAEEYVKGMMGSGCPRKPEFADTCREPFIDVRYCKVKQCCWPGSVAHHYRHFMDQSTCLFTDSLLPAVDYIGETENLENDFEEIIQEINRRKDPELPELVNDLVKKNVHGRRLQGDKTYAFRLFQKHQTCLTSIAKFYNKDFFLLGYEAKTAIP